MSLTITFCRQTVNTLNLHLQAAFRSGNLAQIKHISALLMLADGLPVPTIAQRLSVGRSTISAWLHSFLLDRFTSLHHRKSPGRPSKLSPSQKQRLCQLVAAGPEAAGYSTGCWHAALLQALIWREFGVMYNVHYVSELLGNLGFSYQKARFVSDHLNQEKREEWLRETWPAVVERARRTEPWCCSGMKPALRSGARWPIPEQCEGSNLLSRREANAKAPRSLG